MNKLRAKFESEETENNWAISYGDMITLLLGFFVLFFNIKSQVLDMNLIKKDLDEYFSSKPGPVQKHVVGQKDGSSTSPLYSSDVANSFKVKSNMDGERILIEFPGVSFFGSGNHTLTDEGKSALSDFSKAITKHLGSFRLVVRGYTDGKALRSQKNYKDNLELSAFRSIAAIRYLNEQGIDLKAMRIAGFGESSLSRTDLERDISSLQRKIAIVIEPLDHTEKVDKLGIEGVSSDSKPIEEVVSSQIDQRKVSSVAKEQWQWLKPVKTVYQRIQDTSQTVLFIVNDKIDGSDTYNYFVDQSVIMELQSNGYSKKEAKELLKKYNEKYERTRP